MWMLGKITPEEKQKLVDRGYDVDDSHSLPRDWDGDVSAAAEDERDFVFIHVDENMMDFLDSVL